jgi:hypothetical protein
MSKYPSWMTYSPYRRNWDAARANSTARLCDIKAIALHYPEGPGHSAESVKNHFQSGLSPDLRAREQGHPFVGTHFIIDESKVLACTPDISYVVHHVGGVDDIAANSNPWNRNRDLFVRGVGGTGGGGNYYTVGIEMCHPDVTGKIVPAVLKKTHQVVRWIMKEIKNTNVLIGRHYDFSGKACPIYYSPVLVNKNDRNGKHRPENYNPILEIQIKTARWTKFLEYLRQGNENNIPGELL